MSKKNILICLLLITSIAVQFGCATVWENKAGKLRAVTVARNIYHQDCGDCEVLVVNTTESQSSTLNGVFGNFFGVISDTFSALLPRGFPAE